MAKKVVPVAGIPMPADAPKAQLAAVDVTPEERERGDLSQRKLNLAVAALRQDGVVAIRNAIALTHVDALATKMLADLDAFDRGPRGPLRNHWQGLRPPPLHPHLYRDIVFNDQTIAVLRALLGKDIVLTAYGANTAFALGDPSLQRAHIDHGEPQPEGAPCQAVAIQVLLVDTDEENGATEFWPGSHLAAHSGILNDRWPSEQQQLSWPRGTGRFVCPRGTLVLRDLAMWHRGCPNRTPVHRPMITMIVRADGELRRQLRNGERIGTGFEAELSSRRFWQHPHLWAAVWLFQNVDYVVADAHSHPAQRADNETAQMVKPVDQKDARL